MFQLFLPSNIYTCYSIEDLNHGFHPEAFICNQAATSSFEQKMLIN